MLIHNLTKILNDINSVLMPRVCFGCTAHLHRGEELICTLCRNDMPLTEYTFNDEPSTPLTMKTPSTVYFMVELT